MNTSVEQVAEALRTALRENERLRSRLDEATAVEPVAIVAMSCRYPGGVASPEELWDLVAEGRDAIGEFPADRGWDLEAFTGGRGGFLPEAPMFDAAMFGMGPAEAVAADPQQRLLLEVSWEAFERAGIDPLSMKGSQTGVYVGLMNPDYPARPDTVPEAAEGFLVTGVDSSVASGRVAYVLGLEGPTMSVDTACSSSLVALHLAARALRDGECDLALAGGVTVMSTPRTFIEFEQQQGLAADGRCKPFAAAADGTGWGEGVGMLLLERLSDARRLGHPVLAVVRGSAVNSDGASNGLTAPNGPSQQRVIRRALASAGLRADEVDVVEAHGTGTRLGDPIEAQALLATYGQERERPLLLGSVKSNIGHTQAAAGVAGVIKMVMAMRHGELPRTLHVDEPSPHVEWGAGRVELLTRAQPWPAGGRTRRAGISSFGIGGTNAHVIVEEAPSRAAVAVVADVGVSVAAAPPLVLSGRTEAALRAQAARLADHLAAVPAPDLRDVAHALVTTRAALPHRAAVHGAGLDELLAGLRALAVGEPADEVTTAAVSNKAKAVFVFPGQGSQWAGMALELLDSSPVFARRLRECADAIGELAGWDVVDVLREAPGAPSLERIDVVQPVLFAVMVSLAELWRSYGVRPAAVIGHSQGEVAAACVAGALSLADAAKIVVVRSRALLELSGTGGMAVVALSADQVREWLSEANGVSVAAVNGPSTTVVAGPVAGLEALLERCAADGVWARRVNVDYASHSPQVEAVRERLLAELVGIEPRRAAVPVYSTVTAARIDGTEMDAEYWYTNLRRPVRFVDAVREALRDGLRVFVEAGPHPALASAIEDTAAYSDLADTEPAAAAIGSLRRDDGGLDRFHASVAEAFTHGVPVDWTAMFGADRPRRLDLPTYAFQRRRYWPEVPRTTAGDLASVGVRPAGHPLLGAVVATADPDGALLTGHLSVRSHPWLADHTVAGTILLPGTALVELAIRAGDEVGCGRIEELVMTAPLTLTEYGGVTLRVSVAAPDDDGRRPLTISSRPDGAQGRWTRHATGAMAPDEAETSDTRSLPAQWPPRGAEPVGVDGLYERLAQRGYGYGPAFRGLRALWRRGDEIFAEVALPEPARAEAGRFGLHPALLDAALHALLATDADDTTGEDGVSLPFSWSGVSLAASGAAALRIHLTTDAEGRVTIRLADPAGSPVAVVGSLTSRPVPLEGLVPAAPGDGLFQVGWAPLHAFRQDGDAAATARWAVLGELPSPAARFTDLAALADAVAHDSAAPEVVLLPVEGEPSADDLLRQVREVLADVLATVQRWLADERFAESRLVVVVRGQGADPVAGAVAGLVRAAQAEHPGRFLLLDWDGEGDDLTDAVSAALADDEPEVRLTDDVVRAPRLSAAGPLGVPAAFDPSGTVLITGGTGGLGALFARHLVTEHGARHLLLASRRGPDAPGAAELRAGLTALGADVEIRACDVSDRADLAALLARVPADRPLRAVLHTAGTLADGTVTALDAEAFDTVLRPKADAAWHLHELTRGLDLTHFVLFSSAAGTYEGAGQANYAAANAFLDALARYRRAQCLPAHSLAWGLWEQPSGMLARLTDTDRVQLANSGAVAMRAEEGLRLFDAACATAEPVLVPMLLNLAAVRARPEPAHALLRALLPAAPRRAAAGDTGPDTDGLQRRLVAEPQDSERERILLEVVRRHVGAVLGYADPSDVEPLRSFREMGLDSLSSVNLRNRLSAATGLRLPVTVVFDHPNVQVLARELLTGLLGDEHASPVPVPAAPPVAATDEDPVVIVGMSCRFPGGVSTPEDLWTLVADGVDAITPFPTDRDWDIAALYDPQPGTQGRTYVRDGGFLDDAADFDADFFGMSPREALATDPQQRLLLEASWEAIERAGIDPATLRGSQTGVFAGVMYNDYGSRPVRMPDEGVADYLGNGSLTSVVSGRVAYVLGLEGPTMSVDTACSSSLVALHLAARALRDGECDLALAGGVTVLSLPEVYLDFSRQQGLAENGRAKPFAAAADGTALSEGVGVLVVERLSDARRLGHPVLAVVRGSAVNSDGASNGLTAPNGPSQQRVIRRALASAGLRADEVDVVEAHGTGTRLGDPIEAQALLATYGQERERPLLLGSVKSNIGHTQAAAGVAGVIKMVMAMRHGELPRTLHVDEPSPHVEWGAGRVELLTRAQPWPAGGRTRRAGISSFGIGGTNAHVIVEEAPSRAAVAVVADVGVSVAAAPPLVLSGRTEAALRAQARNLRDWLDREPGTDVRALAHALARTRTAFDHRAAVVAGDPASFASALETLAAGEPSDAIAQGVAAAGGKTAFVFPGQGSQWAGMALELLDSSPVFARRLRECADAIGELAGWDVVDVLREAPGAPSLERIDVVQPVLFAVMVSLAELWRSYGVRPAAVIGHSQGEVAAACVAGALSLADAAKIVVVRSRALLELSGTGGMAVVALSADQVREWLSEANGVSVAAVNGPSTTVVAGPVAGLEALLERCAADGVWARRVEADVAGHSVQVEAVRERLLAELGPIRPRRGTVPWLSTVTGAWMTGAEADAEYWYANVRRTVEFAGALDVALREGHRHFIEVSPHSVLVSAVEDMAEEAEVDAVVVGTLRRGEGGLDRFTRSLTQWWARGGTLDWDAVLGTERPARVDLPTYAFQRRRYWLEAAPVTTLLTAVPGQGNAQGPEDAPAPGEPSLAERLAGLTAPQRRHLLLDLVRSHAAAVLVHDGPENIDPGRGFLELGFDSLTGVELRRRLGNATGLRLPATAIFDHPTPQALAEYLGSELDATAQDGNGAPDPALESTLAGLETLLTSMAGQAPEQHARIGARLTALADAWAKRAAADPDGGGLAPAASAVGLDSASADELFRFLDGELGG
ncbi:type I polyketide synthase [Streptomyces sp. NBC_01217]|uniref:type I polyketide synthase n=1 Tax=Streptomyces sp. NBC_01217 TaxID=2903779 RepID=UPI002E0E80AC|nr:SDR family NAD(P)-dependent oxidoreductase [Streptomyces sp. NBC_01217]